MCCYQINWLEQIREQSDKVQVSAQRTSAVDADGFVLFSVQLSFTNLSLLHHSDPELIHHLEY